MDHALRSGDSLLGLSEDQIARFHWIPDAEPIQLGFESAVIRPRIEKVRAYREEIHQAGANAPHDDLRRSDLAARDEAAEVALYGDLALTAFFDAANTRAREARRKQLGAEIRDHTARRRRGDLEARRTADPPFAPLHWQVEFPEVFSRNNPGFDAIVGNPPFAGKNTKARANISRYTKWLLTVHSESRGNSDLVAHFFRRAFSLLRDGGTLGLVATNSIAEGATRATGLHWICKNGGNLYRAYRRVPWPRQAAVIVSVVHILKGQVPLGGSRRLNGRPATNISAFLLDSIYSDDPTALDANANKSFVGSVLRQISGFTFDDTDDTGVASPLRAAKQLLRADPRNADVIRPLMGGAETNRSPTHTPHRYAIDFRDWPLRREGMAVRWTTATKRERRSLRRQPVVPADYPGPVASDYPELLAIVEKKVKPARLHLVGTPYSRFWWRYGALAKELSTRGIGEDRILAVSNVGARLAFTFLPTGMVYAHTLILFPLSTCAAFCALQARPHEIWARVFSSSLKSDLRYSHTQCFETFPFPDAWVKCPRFEEVGRAYYEHRSDLMVGTKLGLTKTYNRFHDPDEADPAIHHLRRLHETMDRAVLDAYGWTDISTACQFILDYEVEEQEDRPLRRKKPWRYRWPDEVCDEVLSRLLALNAERAAEEDKTRRVAAGIF